MLCLVDSCAGHSLRVREMINLMRLLFIIMLIVSNVIMSVMVIILYVTFLMNPFRFDLFYPETLQSMYKLSPRF